MLQKIKAYFFYKNLKANLPTQNNRQVGMNALKSICILFDGSNEEDRRRIYAFKDQLNSRNDKTIKTLAYLNNSLPLDNVDYSAYNHKNINWYGIPAGIKIEEFIALEYDLLLVLSNDMQAHYEYIIARSKAKFKVGPNIDKAEKYLDLIVEMKPGHNLNQTIDAIIKGLNKIAIK